MKNIYTIILIVVSALTLSSCKEKYNGESPAMNAYATAKGVEGRIIEEGNNEWFVLKTSDQYVVIEAQGLNNFNVNDIVYGDFYGFQGRNIYNSSQNKNYKAWVEGYFSSYSDAINYMNKND